MTRKKRERRDNKKLNDALLRLEFIQKMKAKASTVERAIPAGLTDRLDKALEKEFDKPLKQ